MNKIKIISYTEYTAQQKQIFTNHFITKNDNSKKEFEDFVSAFYKTLPLPKDDQPYIDPKHSYNAIVKKGVIFDTHRTLWDLNTKDNLVTHFLSQPNFYIDSKSLHRLNFVHPNWNHQNNKGENALMLLAQRGELSQLETVAKDFNLDFNAKNRDDKYFTHFLFTVPILKEKPLNMEGSRVLIKAVTYFQKIDKFLAQNPTHLDISPARLQRIAKEWNEAWEAFLTINSQNEKPLLIDAINYSKSYWEKVQNKIDKIQFVRNLEDNMPLKKTKFLGIKI